MHWCNDKYKINSLVVLQHRNFSSISQFISSFSYLCDHFVCLSVCPSGPRLFRKRLQISKFWKRAKLLLRSQASSCTNQFCRKAHPQGAVGVVIVFSNDNMRHMGYHSKAMVKGYNFTTDTWVLGPHPQQIEGVVEQNGAKWDYCKTSL